jgi:hypothetical protein
MEQIKQKQKQDGMIQYTGVVSLYSNGTGTNLYEDIEDGPTTNSYITCDPFSKLKFDDLRKVHKDQTVLSVSESDFAQVKQYKSVDQYVRTREQGNGAPMNKQQAELFLKQQEKEFQETMLRKQHQSQLKTMDYEQKNKTIISNFWRIEDK